MLNAVVTLKTDNKNKSHYCKQSLRPMFTAAQIIRKWRHNGLGDLKKKKGTTAYCMSQWVIIQCEGTKTLRGDRHLNLNIICITNTTAAATYLSAKKIMSSNVWNEWWVIEFSIYQMDWHKMMYMTFTVCRG